MTIHQRRTAPPDARAARGMDDKLVPLEFGVIDGGCRGGQKRPIDPGDGVFEIERYTRKHRGSLVDQFEQFRSGLLFGGIYVLVALDDVDIDGELVLPRRQRLITRRDLRIALRAEVPYGGRVLDQESKVMLAQQGKGARSVGADFFAHARVETVVHMRQREIEMQLDLRTCSTSSIH